MRRGTIVILLALAAYALLAAFIPSVRPVRAVRPTIATQTPAVTYAPVSVRPEPVKVVQDGSGTLGDYRVSIDWIALTFDHDDAPTVVVTYGFTNNSGDSKSFALSLEDKVYQSGIECEKAYFLKDDDAHESRDNEYKDIKPGTSVTVQVAYKLNDTTTPIDVEVKELFDISGNAPSVVRSFEVD